MKENGSLLSRVVDPPGTKGGPRAGNFPGPPKNTLSRVEPRTGTKGPFVPGGGFTRDKRGGLLSRVKPPPGAKGRFVPGRPFVPGRGSPRDKRPPIYFFPSPPFPTLSHFCAVDPPRRRRPELRAAPTESSARAAPRPRVAPPRPRD